MLTCPQVEKRTEVALRQAKLEGAQRDVAAATQARDEVRIRTIDAPHP